MPTAKGLSRKGFVVPTENACSGPRCKICKVFMQRGIYIGRSWFVHGDFIGDYAGEDLSKARRGQTISQSGSMYLGPCWKCPSCGHSLKITDDDRKVKK